MPRQKRPGWQAAIPWLILMLVACIIYLCTAPLPFRSSNHLVVRVRASTSVPGVTDEGQVPHHFLRANEAARLEAHLQRTPSLGPCFSSKSLLPGVVPDRFCAPLFCLHSAHGLIDTHSAPLEAYLVRWDQRLVYPHLRDRAQPMTVMSQVEDSCRSMGSQKSVLSFLTTTTRMRRSERCWKCFEPLAKQPARYAYCVHAYRTYMRLLCECMCGDPLYQCAQEYILVSDASESEVFVQSAANKLRYLFGVTIKHVRTSTSRGFGAAVNLVRRGGQQKQKRMLSSRSFQGNSMATGRYRAILNNDAYVSQVSHAYCKHALQRHLSRVGSRCCWQPSKSSPCPPAAPSRQGRWAWWVRCL